ncbi:MAG: hypothetical protein AYP45_14125 [Candidatus Brocadia carolinensis]|uniref:Uncharacterized protein n=1 Tax=Candidatus Brocadia carolinensis TaxID=1004156 RepID=A0A1V4AR29_9BACT|nr:MAG: hypothetical protein AYP45_14125 [Candidatus Brocadia caroliniensis]
MRERLLRFTRNDNAQNVIKGIVFVIASVFSEAISHFHNGELVVASLRYDIDFTQTKACGYHV